MAEEPSANLDAAQRGRTHVVHDHSSPGFSAGMEYTRVPFWVVLAGVGAGAIWVLAGVLVGWRIARRS